MSLLHVAQLSLVFSLIASSQTYTISTVAGSAPQTKLPGTSAILGGVNGVCVDAQGNIFFTVQDLVMRLDAVTGVLTVVAGNGLAGYNGDGGAATSARFYRPNGVAVAPSGDLYIADVDNSVIRKIDATGIVTTVAGNGSVSFSGDGASATAAGLNAPGGVALDSAGNLYISDTGNSRVRKVSNGIITTVAGNGKPGFSGDGIAAISAQLNSEDGIAVDSAGNLYIADYLNGRIRKVSNGLITTVAGGGSSLGDGGSATDAWLAGPTAVAVDAAGIVYIADTYDNRVRVVSNGIITTFAGIGIAGSSGDGGLAVSASVSYPLGVAVDGTGNVYITDNAGSRVRKISGGVISTVAGNTSFGFSGDGGPATTAQLNIPAGVATDSLGNVYVDDYFDDRIRRVSQGLINTVAGSASYGFGGDSGPAIDAEFTEATRITISSTGDLYISDSGNNRIRKVSNGIVTTIAGNGNRGFSGDNGPATNAQLSFPEGLALDSAGCLYVADTGNARIRKICDGLISTVAGNGTSGFSGDSGSATSAQLNSPTDVALDSSQSLYIADSQNQRIRRLSNGIITTVAGGGSSLGDNGPALTAQLAGPNGIAFDSNNNLFIADTYDYRVRMVSNTTITTVAGNGIAGFSGDLGPGTAAQLDAPIDIAVDSSSGKIYISDTNNNRIRVLTPSSANCSYAVSPTEFTAASSSTSLTVNIQTTSSCSWAVQNLPSWITVSGPPSGSGSATLTLVTSANTGPTRSTQISVAGATVTINQNSDLLSVSTGGVVNAASYAAPVAAGSIVSIFGNFLLAAPVSVSSFPIPDALGGLSFQFSGTAPSPMFYANVGQANIQIPWELAGQSQTTLTATILGQTSAPQPVTIATYAPGIFAINGGGTGQGAILDGNYQLVDSTNPATVGTNLQIYCTGLGPVTNPPATGLPASGTTLSNTSTLAKVLIGGVQAVVSFSGLTPGDVGLYQVNTQVPAGSAKGSSVPVTISIGEVQSNTVTIAVQ